MVFSFGEGGWPCTRIPSVVLAGGGVLVAFAECRARVGDGCQPKAVIKKPWNKGGKVLLLGHWRCSC